MVSLSAAVRGVVRPEELAEFWHRILQDPVATTAEKMAAARELADRGWGKAPAHVVVSQTVAQTLDLGQLSREELKLLSESIKGQLSGNGGAVASLDDIETKDFVYGKK